MTGRGERLLGWLALLLVAAFALYGLYEGFVRGQDRYTLALAAGHRHFEDGRYRQALLEFEVALEVAAADPEALFGVGISHMELGRNQKALQALNAAVYNAVDERMRAYFLANRGILHDRMGAYRQALSDYRLALQLVPETATGPGFVSRLLHNQVKKPPGIADRARYLEAELAKPAKEQLLSLPAIDGQQRNEKVGGR